jgi:hypothetical protein
MIHKDLDDALERRDVCRGDAHRQRAKVNIEREKGRCGGGDGGGV